LFVFGVVLTLAAFYPEAFNARRLLEHGNIALTSVKVEALPTVLLTARNGHCAAHLMVKEKQFWREIV
jgi:hypothetical protein